MYNLRALDNGLTIYIDKRASEEMEFIPDHKVSVFILLNNTIISLKDLNITRFDDSLRKYHGYILYQDELLDLHQQLKGYTKPTVDFLYNKFKEDDENS